MPDLPPPTFHEGCYCFRDEEAEAARASGLPVRCGGGQPCNCIDNITPPYDTAWDNILADVIPSSSTKRSRSQCMSCSCACAILHAASAAATAAAAKIRRCCGGDCRCPPGLCRCPQEAVPVDTYACGALNQEISHKVASILQFEPPPPQHVSNVLQALQPPSTMSSLDITNALHAALQGVSGIPNLQQNLVHQNSQNTCCASQRLDTQQLSNQQLTNPLQSHTTPTCCRTTSTRQSPIPNNPHISTSTPITKTDFHTNVPPLPVTSPKPSSCCAPQSTTPVQSTGVSHVIQTPQLNGEPLQNSIRHSSCCGAASSSSPVHHVSVSQLPTTPRHDSSTQHSPKSPLPIPTACHSTSAKSIPPSAASSKSEPLRNSGDRDRIFTCHLCDAAFKFKQNRDRHINEVHRGLRPHQCDHPGCQSAFKNLSGLKQHKKTVHEKARPFKCSLCERAFGQRNHLSQHILVVHEKVKRYPCNFCDMAFSNVGNRTQHTKRRHPNELLRKQNELQRKENEPRQLNDSST